ncbi:hypothetical protein MCOR25_004900 [Pyricularia grisea]|nr:hypothetical protein MCOR25_004900 [Pyricularia grisea]
MSPTYNFIHRKDNAADGIGVGGGRRKINFSNARPHFVAVLGEFVGTFMFLFFGYAGHFMVARSSTGSETDTTSGDSAQTTIFVALAYGFSLLVTVWAMYRISGGLFNPAVAFGLSLAGQLPWIRTCVLIPTQIVASMCAGGVVSAMLPGRISQVNTTLAPLVSIPQGLFLEMFFTAYLLFVVLMVAAEKSKDTFIAPIAIGLAAFVALIPGVYYTGGALNPVRSFGCAVAGAEFPSYHWIYWVGPFLGSLLGAGLYKVFKLLHYEDANPGQDAAHPDEVIQIEENRDLESGDVNLRISSLHTIQAWLDDTGLDIEQSISQHQEAAFRRRRADTAGNLAIGITLQTSAHRCCSIDIEPVSPERAVGIIPTYIAIECLNVQAAPGSEEIADKLFGTSDDRFITDPNFEQQEDKRNWTLRSNWTICKPSKNRGEVCEIL